MRKKLVTAGLATLALVLAGCSDPGASEELEKETEDTAAAEESVIDTIEEVPDIAAMVPDTLVTAGTLTNGASTDYPPAEYLMDDGKTPVGYDVDIVQALAKVMGLEQGVTKHAVFETIIPALGTKFDVGASSFTITPERIKQVNMISYVEVGSAYAVKKGNPSDFDPADPCGTTLGVQTGTFQHEYALELSEQCVADGKDAINVMPHDLQSEVTTKVTGGQYDATLADTPVIVYAISASNDLEQIGDQIETEPQGIAVAKSDEQLTAAVQAAMQYLMDEGYLDAILSGYGAEGTALTQANVN